MIKIIGDIWNITKKSFSQFYNNLILFIIINLAWFILILILNFIGFYGVYNKIFITIIFFLLPLGPLLVTGLYIVNEIKESREIGWRKIVDFTKGNFKKGIYSFLIMVLLYSVLIIDIYYFFNKFIVMDPGIWSYLLMILNFIIIYILVFFSLMQLYFWGLMIYQNKEGIIILFKKAFLLTMDNLLFSFLWLLLVLISLIIFVFTGFGLLFFFPTFISLIILNGTELILGRY
ncbi:MAG: hypothetical protein ACOCQS_02680 [Bacillota bacterium]